MGDKKEKGFSWSKKDYSGFSTSSKSDYFGGRGIYWDGYYSDYYYDDYSSRYSGYYSTGSSYKSERKSSMSSFMSSSYGVSSYLKSTEEDTRRKELFDKSLKLTREFISILNFPFSISIYVDNDLHEVYSGLSSRALFLPTKVLDSISTRNDDDIINTIVGQGLHEAAHLKYTNLKVIGGCESSRALKNYLVNIIEDERVDRLLVIDRPGYSIFIEAAKKFCIGEADVSGVDISIVGEILLNLTYLLRYPEKVNSSVFTEHEDLFKEVGQVLKNFPKRSIDVFDTVDKITNILLSHDLDYDELDSISARLKDRCVLPLLYGEDKCQFLEAGGSPGKFISSKLRRSSSSSELKIGVKESLGIIEKFEGSFYIVHDVEDTGDSEKYNEIRTKVSKYIPIIKNKLQTIEKNTKFNISGCRSGLLDTTKLVEAYQDVPQVYTRVGTVTTNKVTVCVLVDESGSMSGKRERTARDAAILLYESLKDLCGIDLFIYGHTADVTEYGSTEVRSYIEPGKKNKLSLCNIQARWENRDGDAILGVARRVRKHTQDKCLMFVLSDGQPCASDYWGAAAINDSAQKIQQAKALGFDIMQITISGDISHTKRMFGKDYIDLRNSVDELPEKLGKLIRDHVMKNKTTTMTT